MVTPNELIGSALMGAGLEALDSFFKLKDERRIDPEVIQAIEKKAIVLLLESIKHAPHYYVHLRLGKYFLVKQDFKKSIYHYNKTIEMNPCVTAYEELAEALEAINDFDGAIKALLKAVDAAKKIDTPSVMKQSIAKACSSIIGLSYKLQDSKGKELRDEVFRILNEHGLWNESR